jgi:uncharacterized protein involved in exopolysaccharide biosynthesis
LTSIPGTVPDVLAPFLRKLWRARYAVLAAGLIGAAIAIAFSLRAVRMYQGTVTLLVRQASALSPTVATTTIRPVIANHAVAQVVVGQLGLKQDASRFLRDALSIEDVPGTFLLRVVVRLPDPKLAADAANLTVREAIKLNAKLTETGDDRRQRVMQDELATARNRMDDTEAAVRAFRLRRDTRGAAIGIDEESIEGARLHAEHDLATRLYEEIAVQFGKLRLQVTEQVAELVIIEDAFPPVSSVTRGTLVNGLFGAVTGLTVGLLVAAVIAVLQGAPNRMEA